ncbi:MAG: endonuclease III [ANME-2 cluster archaeon]|nr:endonuclease III [ANME-2 cluster archaeon]MBC2701248.1 endonuclease III [ANME-2 cluster archaeon]MBC2708672.1 endonuclease III [ANME-2 cluster archaeon]MBC2748232.1 endonuclease III [ANME-2 cluster archaeon]MBC2762128.1 endonuclease III [ANME-2 cluster archaeon]
MKPAGQMLEMIRLLKDEYPISRTALRYETPHQMLVATILSAQCTDVRVNMVTEELFRKYKGINEFAEADLQELEQDIRSTGFYRQKAKNIKNSSIEILENFSGNVPDTMEELITLPGVGRKTANVVLSSAYNITEGIAVDTHVKRLSFRLGLTRYTDPDKIEADLMKLAPKEEWSDLSYRLILHGRAVCSARKPEHGICMLQHLCPRMGVK